MGEGNQLANRTAQPLRAQDWLANTNLSFDGRFLFCFFVVRERKNMKLAKEGESDRS